MRQIKILNAFIQSANMPMILDWMKEHRDWNITIITMSYEFLDIDFAKPRVKTINILKNNLEHSYTQLKSRHKGFKVLDIAWSFELKYNVFAYMKNTGGWRGEWLKEYKDDFDTHMDNYDSLEIKSFRDLATDIANKCDAEKKGVLGVLRGS